MRPPAPIAEREAAWRKRWRLTSPSTASTPTRSRAGPGRAPFSTEWADVLEEFQPRVVSFHFGLPPTPMLVARVEALGSADSRLGDYGGRGALARSERRRRRSSRKAQRQAVTAACFSRDDVSTQVGTLSLVPQIVRAVKVPVIAAGGIGGRSRRGSGDGARGRRRAGRHRLSALSRGHDQRRAPRCIARATPRARRRLTNLFTGRPARGIVNRIDARARSDERPRAAPSRSRRRPIAPLRAKAEAQGKGDFSPLWAGQNASGCKEIPRRRAHASSCREAK